MNYQSGKPIQRALTQLSSEQGGYFTARQAAQIGYDRRRLAYHVQVGTFERAGQGVYRVHLLPLTEHDDLVRAMFWSRDRHDQPQAVVSHRTALSVHGLSDLFAEAIHLSVPRSFRKSPPKGWVLHKAALDASEITMVQGFRVTTPLRTLVDCSDDAGIPFEQLALAVSQVLERGIIPRRTLLATAQHHGGRLAEVVSKHH
jgi:predicted transcriptional regulator of viral defense system